MAGQRLAFLDGFLPVSCHLHVTLLSASNVGVSFGATELFKSISFTVAAGERWGIIGRNGAGKTSIFKVITGDLQPTVGSVARKPGLRHALLDQHRAFDARPRSGRRVRRRGARSWCSSSALPNRR
ncbi:MAG: ATP-binding cassette domain-containing protein [Gemmatimonadaceae bacterium]